MADLAFNFNGEIFEVPASVVAWRVRRMKARGAPELVYGRDGRPLQLAIDASIDDLRDEVEIGGKYRLDGVADDGKVVAEVPAAYVVVPQADDALTAPAVARPGSGSDAEGLLRDAMRFNTEIAKSVIDRFPAMMDAAARLIEAADGAGIAARAPFTINAIEAEADEDQDDTHDVPRAVVPTGPFGGLDLNALIAQLVPLVVTRMMNGGIDLSNLGALFDWRKAAPKSKPAASSPAAAPPSAAASRPVAAHAAPVSSPSAPPATVEAANVPTIDPAAMVHFLAIQQALSPEEAALAKEVAKGLAPAELNAWIADLAARSIPDAVATIRAITSKLAPVGGAS